MSIKQLLTTEYKFKIFDDSTKNSTSTVSEKDLKNIFNPQ
jgi:hypothetical protein